MYLAVTYELLAKSNLIVRFHFDICNIRSCHLISVRLSSFRCADTLHCFPTSFEISESISLIDSILQSNAYTKSIKHKAREKKRKEKKKQPKQIL